MENPPYDVAIIGSGPGGYVAAIRAGQLGLKTLLVEKDKTLGGTCLNVGCIPSKALLTSSHIYDFAKKKAALHGVHMSGLSYDLKEMMERKDKVVLGFNQGIAALMKKNKVTVMQGEATFISKNTLKIGDAEISAKNFILATGSIPSCLPFLPFDEEKVLSSTGALCQKEVPKRLLVIGAGVIGVEIGSIYQRLGSEVVFIEFLDHICGAIDLEMSRLFQKILEKEGLIFNLSTKVEKASVDGEGVTLFTTKGEMRGDKVLVAVGRSPYTKSLGLEAAGVTLNRGGFIEVNSAFQTTNPHIYAIGDVIGQPMLAHKASEEGNLVAEILAGHSKLSPLDYATIPSVVYTHPELASVGFSEEELKERNILYHVQKFPLKANSRARSVGEEEGIVKLLVEPSGRLLGAHIIAEGAGEIIHECTLAIHKRLLVKELASLCHAHPTLSEAIKEAALKQPLHI